MTGGSRGRIKHHLESGILLGPQTTERDTPGMFLPHAVAAVEQDAAFATPLVAAERTEAAPSPSAFICGCISLRCGFPPQSRIVLPFENPPDVLRAVGRLVHKVPPGVEEGLGRLHLGCGPALAPRTYRLS